MILINRFELCSVSVLNFNVRNIGLHSNFIHFQLLKSDFEMNDRSRAFYYAIIENSIMVKDDIFSEMEGTQFLRAKFIRGEGFFSISKGKKMTSLSSNGDSLSFV